MAIFKCPECGAEKECRCKPKTCEKCNKPVAFIKK